VVPASMAPPSPTTWDVLLDILDISLLSCCPKVMLSTVATTTCLSYHLPGASTTDYYERKGGEEPSLTKRPLDVEGINLLSFMLSLSYQINLFYNPVSTRRFSFRSLPTQQSNTSQSLLPRVHRQGHSEQSFQPLNSAQNTSQYYRAEPCRAGLHLSIQR
jgi:hypothetical protein